MKSILVLSLCFLFSCSSAIIHYSNIKPGNLNGNYYGEAKPLSPNPWYNTTVSIQDSNAILIVKTWIYEGDYCANFYYSDTLKLLNNLSFKPEIKNCNELNIESIPIQYPNSQTRQYSFCFKGTFSEIYLLKGKMYCDFITLFYPEKYHFELKIKK